MPTQESDRQLDPGERTCGNRAQRFVLGPESLEDPATVGTLYDELYPELRAHAMKLLRSPERADDAIHTAFANTIAALKRGRLIEEADRWLHRCVRNACLYELRMDRTVSDNDLSGLPAACDLVESAHWRIRSEELYRAVGELPEHLRTALLLSEVRGLTYIEVAAQMRRSVDSVRALIFRARAELRDALDTRGEGLFVPLAGALAAGRAAKNLWRRVHDALCAKLGEAHALLTGLFERALRPAYEQALTLGALGLLAAGVGGPGPAHSPMAGSVSQLVEPVRVRISAGAPHAPGARPGRAEVPAKEVPTADRMGAAPVEASDAHPLRPRQAGSAEPPASTVARHSDAAPVPPGGEAKVPVAPPVSEPGQIDPPESGDRTPGDTSLDPDGSRAGSRVGSNGEVSAVYYGANGEQRPAPGEPSGGQAGGSVPERFRKAGADARGPSTELAKNPGPYPRPVV